MNLLNHIKTTILLLLTFLLGATPTHAKTEAIVFVPSYTQHFAIAQTAQSHTPQKTAPLNTEFTLPDGTTFEGNCNIAEYQGERYVELVNGGSTWLTKLDNLFAKPHFNQFQSKLIDFSSWGATSTSQRLAKYGTPTALKNRIKSLLENSTVNNIKSPDEIIDYIDDFMLQYANKPPDFGALAYFDELVMTPSKFKGGAYGLEILNNLPQTSLNGKTLVKFEASIDDLADASTGCRFDMQFDDGTQMIFVETKNYASSTSFSSSFYNQFKAYISNPNVTNINQIKYFFRANTGITKAERVQKFKNMLLNGDKYEEIFNANQTLMNSLGLSENNYLKALLESDNVNHQFFNFIEIF